jgi:4-amino-4-deoxy-L-arabinose transferase-like glycosyltransferase
MKLKNLVYFFLGIIFLYYFFLGINLPYVGSNATNFNDYSLIAKNYNLFGLWNTKFAQIVSVAKSMPNNPEYYLHHPPLLSILEALLFYVFGYDFWVGRLTVIIFSLGSIFLVYFVSKILVNKKYALISSFVYAYIPGTTIFGKMIGQEALVLFFCLSTILFVLKYLKNKSTLYFILIIVSVLFGTLSDWPMVYFSLLFSIYLYLNKEIKLSLAIIFTSVIIALLYLAYIYHFMSGFSDINQAILTRSLGQLVGQQFWFSRWVSVIILRIFLYFNPIFVALGFYYLFNNKYKLLNIKKNSLFSIVLISIGFGLIHILLYPEGSFGHPYWIYYLIPFLVFSSSIVLYKLLKFNKLLFILIVIFTLLYSLPIQYWKYEQTKSNVWRYELAKDANHNFYNYEPIEVNEGSVIDKDLIRYVFSHETKIISKTSQIDEKNYGHFLYSCSVRCLASDKIFSYLSNTYKYASIFNIGGEAYIFDLKTKQQTGLVSIKSSTLSGNVVQESKFGGKIGNIYRLLKDFLNVPQI